MKKIIFIFAVFAILSIMFIVPAQAKSNSDDVDSFLEEVEQKIPNLEKYAELLVKLLNNDKHLARIKNDLKRISKKFQDNSSWKAEGTHLFKAMKSFDISMSQLIIEQRYYIYDPYPKFFLTGGNSKSGPLGKLLLQLTPQQMEKIVILMNRIIDILTPVYVVANEKLDAKLKDFTYSDFGRYELAVEIYSIFSFRGYYFNLLDDFRHGKEKMTFFYVENKKIPNSYLEMLKNYVEFVQITNRYKKPNEGWNYYVKAIDKILSERAESVDMFDDLNDDKPEVSPDSKSGKDNDDLNFDDIKLPE